MSDKQDLIIDFTHVYPKELEQKAPNLNYIDCSDISGTNMYCTLEAEAKIKKRLRPFSIDGIHLLDTGNYHYVSRFFTDRIYTPFSLILFDYHNDMQIPLIPNMTSCGSWARQVIEKNKYLHQLVIIGPDQKTISEIKDIDTNKLICISLQELEKGEAKQKFKEVDRNVPIYFSIDKDVLAKSYARTSWSQGRLSLPTLEKMLRIFLKNFEVIGADICGEYSDAGTLLEYKEAERINSETDQKLCEILNTYL